VPAAALGVIEGWTNALRTDRPARAASYWAHPSVMVNGPDATGQVTFIHILNSHEAELADETLSCGATLRHTKRSGKYVEGEFTLSTRTGAGASSNGCSGPANVDFLIHGGHIARWLRAPVATGAAPGKATPTVGGANPQSV
jgi:hypothetical protein